MKRSEKAGRYPSIGRKVLPLGFLLAGKTLLPAAAQSAPADTTFLNEVVVSASKFSEKRRWTPSHIEEVTGPQIRFSQPSNAADLLLQTGQVMVQKSQGGGGSVMMRGFEASRVLLVLDGLRLNNAISRGGHIQHVLRIDPSLLEKVELLYGTGSVLYGSDALGGVMAFRTRDPPLSPAARPRVQSYAYARYATATSERTAHADVGVGYRRWGLLASLTAAGFGDIRQGRRRMPPEFERRFFVEQQNGSDVVRPNPDPALQVGSGYRQYDAYAKVLFAQHQHLTHRLNLQYSTTGDVPRYGRLTEITANGKPGYAAWYYGPERRTLLSYTGENTRTGRFADRLQWAVARQFFRESRHSRRFQATQLKNQLEAVGVWSVNADARKQLGPHRLGYGIELIHNTVNSAAFFRNMATGAITAADTRYPDGGSTYASAAAYAADQWQLSPQWLLSSGLRYNAYWLRAAFNDKTFFPFPFSEARQSPQAFSGQLGLVFSPDVRQKYSLSAGTGFKAPNVDDLGKVFDSAPGTLIVPNPDLRPEYTYTLEANATRAFGCGLRLEATAYHTELRQAIQTAPFLLGGQSRVLYDGVMSMVFANQNAGRAYIRGAFMALHQRLGPHLRGTATLTYTYGRLRQAVGGTAPLGSIPPLYGLLKFLYETPGLQLEAYAQGSARKRLQDYQLNGEDNLAAATPTGMPAYVLLGLRASVPVKPWLRLQLAADNLLDQNARTFASNISLPGRNFTFSVVVNGGANGSNQSP